MIAIADPILQATLEYVLCFSPYLYHAVVASFVFFFGQVPPGFFFHVDKDEKSTAVQSRGKNKD